MKKQILLVCLALLSLFGATAQIPVNSTTNGTAELSAAEEALTKDIANATTLKTNAVVGTFTGQYTQTAVDNLTTAITTANSVLNTIGATDADFTNASAALLTAVDNFKARGLFLPTTGIYYKIAEFKSGNVIGLNTGTQPALKTPAAIADQAFLITPVDGATDTYYIQNKDGKYLSKKSSSGWDTEFLSDKSNESKWVIGSNEACLGFRLKNVVTTGYLAPDATASGSLLYCDKSVSDGNSMFKLMVDPTYNTDPLVVAKENLSLNIGAAKNLIAKSTVGTLPGNYLQASVDALTTAIGAAIAVSNTATTTVDIANITAALSNAISDFKPVPPFMPAAGVQYKIVELSTSNVIGLSTGTQPALMTAAAVNNQSFEFISTGAVNTYYIKNIDGQYLSLRLSNPNPWSMDFTTTNSTDGSKWLISADGVISNFKLINAANILSSTGNMYLAADDTATGNSLWGDKEVSNANTFKLEVILTTGVNNTGLSNINVTVVNRMFIVTGTDAAVKAYTVTGVPVNATKELTPGIYIVKVADKTMKVSVQ